LPPKLAPIQVVIIPIYKNTEQLDALSAAVKKIKTGLEALGISVKYDDRDNNKPGWKFADYELKGVPVRLAIGPRDLENNTIEIARRDNLTKETIAIDSVIEHVPRLLDEIQANIYNKALKFREENTFKVDTWDEFLKVLDNPGGFIMAHWDGTVETEEKIKEETKATIRCIPFDSPEESGKCVYSGKPSTRRVLFARSY
jgi:prolyl-tRNA synthetase